MRKNYKILFLSCLTVTLVLLLLYNVDEANIFTFNKLRELHSFSGANTNKETSHAKTNAHEDIPTEDIQVFQSKTKNKVGHIEKVPTINDNIVPPDLHFQKPTLGGENIIFVETSCVVKENNSGHLEFKLLLNPQQACAIESTARSNPDAVIYLFYTCPVDATSLSRSSEMVRKVFAYPNVYYWHQSMKSFFKGTTLEMFYVTGKMKLSKFPESHASDVLRFMILWRFGGTYLDLDFIVRRPLSTLGRNFACAEFGNFVASGAMRFNADSLGRRIAEECIEEISTNFNGDVWNYNGPALITRVLKKLCGVSKTELMTEEACNGFLVLPSAVFYPILYDWIQFFDESRSTKAMEQLQNSHAVHTWNSLIVRQCVKEQCQIRTASKQAIVLLEKEYCPVVYSFLPEITSAIAGYS